MLSTAFFIATFAVSSICSVSGLDVEDKNAAALVNCMQTTWEADAADLEAKGGHWSSQEKIDESCTFLALYGRCVLKSVQFSSPIPDAVLSNLAFAWQQMVLSEKVGICQNLPRDELKKRVLPSGILERENLVNIEEDDYEECAGGVVRKCTIDGFSRFEERANKYFLITLNKYFSCVEDEAKTCNAKILHDFIAYLKANERHFQEGQGEFGKMVEKISLPHMEL